MKPTRLLLLASFAMLCTPAFAQAPGGPPAPPQNNGAPPRGGMYRQGPGRGSYRDGGHDRGRDGRGQGHGFGPEHGGLMGILPPGMWWKNPEIVTKLSLTADQQTKMDDIFRQNRLQLVDVKASLEKEQINLEPLLNANPVDTNKALTEISKIADLRAGLEKANAKMLLGLRAVLTADQWTKLHTRPERGGQPGGQGQPGGPRGGGPRGNGGPGGPAPAGDGLDMF
jgi:Spy/CpxP family protein refolding chaperone